MSKQVKQNTNSAIYRFPDVLYFLLNKPVKDGKTTTYKALGEAVGVRQQTISQYVSGQSQPTAEVLLKIAKFFNISVDLLLTGVSAKNKSYNEELGLSESSIELLKKAKGYAEQKDTDRANTIPYLDELLSDKEFFQFLEDLHYYVENLKTAEAMDDEMRERFKGLNVEDYFVWKLQMLVQEFALKEINKLGLNIVSE